MDEPVTLAPLLEENTDFKGQCGAYAASVNSMCRLREGLAKEECLAQSESAEDQQQCENAFDRRVAACMYDARLPKEDDYARIAKECPERDHRGCIPSSE